MPSFPQGLASPTNASRRSRPMFRAIGGQRDFQGDRAPSAVRLCWPQALQQVGQGDEVCARRLGFASANCRRYGPRPAKAGAHNHIVQGRRAVSTLVGTWNGAQPLNCEPDGGGWIRTNVGVRQRIYSPSPLASRAPLRAGRRRSMAKPGALSTKRPPLARNKAAPHHTIARAVRCGAAGAVAHPAHTCHSGGMSRRQWPLQFTRRLLLLVSAAAIAGAARAGHAGCSAARACRGRIGQRRPDAI